MVRAGERRSTAAASGPRFGVEEEFLVVDPVTRVAVPRADAVLCHAAPILGASVSGEITQLQLETRTRPCTSVTELLEQLVRARAVLATSARAHGVRVVASGTPVLAEPGPPPVTQGARQAKGMATFRGLHDELAICALHVHVEVASRERALMISNQLRPYLPILITITANSPYWDGRDSGYASWRTMTWTRWPVAGPPPHFTSTRCYDDLVESLLAAGALVDAGTIFWDVRPSARQPTLEIRVADVPITAEESAMFAAVVRALVTHLSKAIDRGEAVPTVRDDLLRASYWRAARDGLAGAGIDARTGELVPAAELARRLVTTVAPVLAEQGAYDLVAGCLEQLLSQGTGATRQRAAAHQRGDLRDVVDVLIEQTAPATASGVPPGHGSLPRQPAPLDHDAQPHFSR